MKRILHISKYYEPFKGGTEQVARYLVGALSDTYRQKVICFNHEPGTRVDRIDGVEVIRAGCFAKVASQSLSLDYGRLLRREMRSFEPDIVVFHYPNPFVARILLRCLPARARLVVYWHLDIVRQKLLGKLFDAQNRRLIRRADRIIATSRAYFEGSRWLRGVPGKVVVIPNCIDVSRLEMTPEAERIARDIRARTGGRTLCLAVGRHTRYKGFDILIRAARRLDDSFQVCIAGTGRETPKLKRMAADVPWVRFLGRVSESEMNAYMHAMDVFCFPSVTRNEAFGLALAEAMYCQKPAVTFTIPGSGVNDVCLNGEDGIEVANGDADAFAEAVRRLAADARLRRELGLNGRRRVEENFLYAQFESRARALIDGLADGPRG